MARQEDMAARNPARNGAGFEPGFDEPQGIQGGSLRRDPRQPPPGDLRGRAEPPLRAQNPPPPQGARGQAPGLNPQFDPYMQPPAAPQRPAAPQSTRPLMQEPPRGGVAPQQGYQQDPYAAQRPQRQPGAVAPTAGIQGQTARPAAPAGYPPQSPGYAPLQGQPARNPAARPADGYDAVPASRRSREPFFEAPPSARQPLQPRPAAAPAGLAQDGYGDGRFGETHADAEAGFADDEIDAEDEDGDEEYYPDEPAPRGRRGMLVAMALGAAVLLGGGAGAVYKFGFNHAGASTVPQLVQADAAPAKVIPAAAEQGADPGKKTILDRPDSAAGVNAAPSMVASQEQVAVGNGEAPATDNLAGPRKVATVVVKPGEKIAAMATPPADGQQVDSVPGIMIGNDDPAAKPAEPVKAKSKAAMAQAQAAAQAQAQADAAAAAAQDQPAATDPAPAQAPVKLGKAGKKTKVAAVTPPPADMPADGAADAVPPDPAAAMAKASGAAPAHKAGGGYIIQVRSTKTQADALAYFADLQQRYGDILGSAQPDIQEADLGAKGKWYRLRIGPPGSGAAAKDLCTKLKASGLDACIVATY